MGERISERLSKKIDNPKFLVLVMLISTQIMFFISNIILKTFINLILTIQNQDLKFLRQIKVIEFLKIDTNFLNYYLISLIVIVILNIKIIYRIKTSFGSIARGQKGTSEFTTSNELREQYMAVHDRKKEFKGTGGVPISREGKKIFIDDSPVNNLIIGTTRSGKGETFVFQSIDIYSRAEKKASMIINDPKGELVSASYKSLLKRGYDIQVLNLLNPLDGMNYNPLQLIIDAYKDGEYSKAQSLCNTLTFSLYNDPTAKDKFWQNSAQSLVNAIILALTHDFIENGEEEKITMYAVANFLSEYGSKEDEDENNELDNFFQKRDSFDIAKMQYATSNFAKGTTRGGIFSSAMVALQIFTFEEIAKMTSKNSCNLSDIGFGEKPVAIFMVVPDYDASNHVIASIFVRQLYYILAQKASLSDGQKCSREVKFILDEFGNMPPIEGMANIITVCLGRNIRFDLIIQSYSQLTKLYGEDKNTIVGNCGNQIYILTNDLSTAEHFSKLVGYKTISTKSRSGKNLSMDKSQTEGIDKRELLTANELMSLKEGETVVVRVIKRQDLKGKKIKPKPIFNTGKNTLKYRYEYLGDDFDTNNNVLNIKTKILLNISKDLVNELPNIEIKTILLDRISKVEDKIQLKDKALENVNYKESEFDKKVKEIKKLNDFLNELPDGSDKEILQIKLNRIQSELKKLIELYNAENVLERAEADLEKGDLDFAQKLIFELDESDKKTELQKRLKDAYEEYKKLLKLLDKSKESKIETVEEAEDIEICTEKKSEKELTTEEQLEKIKKEINYKVQINEAIKSVERVENSNKQEDIDITKLTYDYDNEEKHYECEELSEDNMELTEKDRFILDEILKKYPEFHEVNVKKLNKKNLKEFINSETISKENKNEIKNIMLNS